MALVLTRKEMESIVITTEAGTKIIVTVFDIAGGKCRVAIDAPRKIKVVRDNAKQVTRRYAQ